MAVQHGLILSRSELSDFFLTLQLSSLLSEDHLTSEAETQPEIKCKDYPGTRL